MDRRTFLATGGALTAGFAGCLQDGGTGTDASTDSPTKSESDVATDETATAIPPENDGYPDGSVVEDPPDPVDVDASSFATITTEGVEVPLVPVDVAHNWYLRREARFADARGAGQYDRSHVTGAVLSPADDAVSTPVPSDADPATAWPKGDRIVCYCGCPHHLSSMRAASFLSNGYEDVYAIDEGFRAWLDRDYPTTGDESSERAKVIRGRADASDAGEYAWAVHEASEQQEAAPIRDDGSYEMELYFGDLAASAPIHIRTPSYELTAPLSELTDDVVTAPDN